MSQVGGTGGVPVPTSPKKHFPPFDIREGKQYYLTNKRANQFAKQNAQLSYKRWSWCQMYKSDSNHYCNKTSPPKEMSVKMQSTSQSSTTTTVALATCTFFLLINCQHAMPVTETPTATSTSASAAMHRANFATGIYITHLYAEFVSITIDKAIHW